MATAAARSASGQRPAERCSGRARGDSLSLFGLAADLRAFMVATLQGEMANVQRLLAADPGLLNRTDNLGWTALMHAADQGHAALARFFLEQPQLNVNTYSTVGGVSALLVACSRGHEAIVQMLVKQRHLRVNQVNALGWSPLMLSSFENQRACVDAILSHKDIDVLAANCKGVTSLLMATMRGNQEIIQAHLRKSRTVCLQASWFSKARANVQGDRLRAWAKQNAASALPALRALARETKLPAGHAAYITTLAFGNEIIAFGPRRGDLLQIMRFILELDGDALSKEMRRRSPPASLIATTSNAR